MSPNEPLAFQFHQQVVNLFFVLFTEYPYQLNTCSNKVATISALNNPNIFSPTGVSPECSNKAISCHIVCCLYVNSTTAQECEQCTMALVVYFDLFSTFYITVAERWFLYQPSLWKVNHLLLVRFTASFSAIGTFRSHLFYGSSTNYYPETVVPNFIYCSFAATMSNPSAIKIDDN